MRSLLCFFERGSWWADEVTVCREAPSLLGMICTLDRSILHYLELSIIGPHCRRPNFEHLSELSQ